MADRLNARKKRKEIPSKCPTCSEERHGPGKEARTSQLQFQYQNNLSLPDANYRLVFAGVLLQGS